MEQCENRNWKLQSQNQYLDATISAKYLDATISAKIAKLVHTCTQVNSEPGLRMQKIPTVT